MKPHYKFFLVPVLFLSMVFAVSAQDEVSQREVIALLELQDRTKGHQWKHKWDRNIPMSQWHGVTIKNGKLVGLDLSNNNLQGRIPLTIGNLKHLEYLNLSNNNIKGKMPRLFRKLKDLKTMNFAGNQLKGKLPRTIFRLQNLRELDVANNNLEGELPATLITLSKLTTLAVANNDFEGTMPQGMERMRGLKRLYIGNNQFTNLDNLKVLAAQQLVLTDIDVNSPDFKPLDFTGSAEGLSKLEFEDDNDDD